MCFSFSLESFCTWRRELGATSQPVSWRPLGEANLTLTKQFPLNGENRVAMHLGGAGARSGAGITNSGFWGVPVRQGARYELSMYLRHPGSDDVSVAPLCLQLHAYSCGTPVALVRCGSQSCLEL
jgi:alpha-N-arabinofuranosidase